MKIEITSGSTNVSHLDQARVLDGWDDFVAGLKSGHVFQSTVWATYRQRFGWHSTMLARSDGASLQAVCLVLHRRVAGLPIGGMLYASRGPVLDYDSPEASGILSEILDELAHLGKSRGAVVRISPDVGKDAAWADRLLRQKGFAPAQQAIQHTTTVRLDLRRPLEDILASARSRRRTQIRKYEREGEKEGWSFYRVEGDAEEELRTFHHLYRLTLERSAKGAKSLEDMRVMHNALSPQGLSHLFMVKRDGKPVCGALLVGMGGRLWYLYGGSASGNDGSGGSGVILHWEIIKWAKERGYVEYDLQGYPQVTGPGDPMYGIYQFKRGWGGTIAHLLGEYEYAPFSLARRLVEWKLSRQKSW